MITTISRTSNQNNYNYLTIGGKRLLVETAKTAAEREKGLSGRKELCFDCGLLFTFPQKQRWSFWMKQMYFDIDIIWIDGDKIVDITIGAKKPSLDDFNNPKEVYAPNVPVDKVLEVNSGWVEQKDIKIGDMVIIR